MGEMHLYEYFDMKQINQPRYFTNIGKGTKQRPLFFSSEQSLSLPSRPNSFPSSLCPEVFPFSYKKKKKTQIKRHKKALVSLKNT